MIEINLLPEEFRHKEERINILPQVLLYTLIATFGLFIILHLYLGSSLLIRSLQYKSLHKSWSLVSSQLFKVNEWKKQFNISSQQTEQMKRLLAERITISDKMQILAQALPNGIWFNHLNLKEKELNLKGSVVSLKKDQMSLLNIFLNHLKEDNVFFKDFKRLRLGNMNMRSLGGFSIMDFVLEGELK